jgi:hypothetical protein
MEQVIKRPTIEKLLERTFIARLKWGRQQRPAPGTRRTLIDFRRAGSGKAKVLAQGWCASESELPRAK